MQPESKPKKRKLEQTCPVCVEKYSVRRKRLPCPYMCGFEACTPCHTKYIKDKTIDAHCMHCRREWSFSFLRTHFSEKQRKELAEQKKLILVAKDERGLPEAQRVVEIHNHNIEVGKKINILHHQIEVLRGTILNASSGEIKDTKESTTENTYKCPLGDCRGYMKRGLCGLCKKRICMKCMQERQEEHVCKPEDLDNMSLIRKDSKMCPKCGVWTMKTQGCNQMWCVNCHAAWDWSTRQEIHGNIHNPHFFEWQMKTKGSVERNPMDVVCGGLPTSFRSFKDGKFLNAVLACVHHIQAYRFAPTQPHSQDLQIQYIQAQITKKQWGDQLYKRYKSFELKQQFFQVHEMFRLAATDILIRRFHERMTKDEARIELEALRSYYNTQLLRIAEEHGGQFKKLYQLITDHWRFADWKSKYDVEHMITKLAQK